MPKRSLMLAGGGVKIAFQAGVLQVWLDEAGLEFDHADGVSAATFNLAMWAQGMTGREIADNWRNLEPLGGVDVNWTQLARLIYAESLFELDAYRRKIFPAWGLDFEKIRQSPREATFNVYNFTRHELRPVTAPEMTEDFLVAAASLPMWFPPVRIDGDTYIDAVLNTASNIEEAIRRGADELWVIWTTSQRGEWFDGFVGNFFGIFEATTNHAYKQALARIARNNEAVAAGSTGEFGRHITVRELKAEVPLHYLLNFSRDRAAEAVNRGVAFAREWCDANGIARQAGEDYPSEVHTAQTSLRFTEKLKGFVGFGATEHTEGFEKGKDDGDAFEADLTIRVSGVNRFITTPEHEAAIEGSVVCERLGGRLPVRGGVFNVFVDEGDPAHKKVLYRLFFDGGDGTALTLGGFKDLKDDPGFDSFSDATTVFVKLYRGTVPAEEEDAAEVLAAGRLGVGMVGFLKQLTSFRAEGPTAADRASALARFGAFYLGRLWDVYARRLLSSGPF
ncbi:MAG TPA: patatin-like phospholipase family protein [Pyrinomonadaceae bacterium]|jgi:predicted patatin/cPLA2 family phospholipase|nr:patatin-like phospholipase family protein [Pyrinomonadaceae bacterium]